MSLGVLVAVGFVIFIAIYETKWKLPRNYPPTPKFRLPFFGHSLYLRNEGKNYQKGFNKIFDRFNVGGVLCLHVAARIRMVMISDFNILKKAFKSEDLTFRLAHKKSIEYCKNLNGGIGVDGILWSYGSIWKQQRRFMLTTLKDFGFGRKSMEDTLLEEAKLFTDFLGEENSITLGNVPISNLFNIGILNVLWRIVAGTRYDYRNPELRKIVEKVGDAILSTNLKPTIAAIFPFLRKIFPGIDHTKDITAKIAAVHDFLRVAVKEQEKSFDPDNIRDFIDSYLLKIQESEQNPTENNDSFRGELGRLNLIKMLGDLFFAGSETTSSTLSWGILYMVRNPKVQKRVQEELDRVLQEDDGYGFRMARTEDRVNLPYTEAVIAEVQRKGNIAPMALPHANYEKDVQIGKYKIPKGHVVSAHLTHLFNNPKYFGEDAEQFNPQRFLRKDGDKLEFVKNEYLIPFGIGKRSCPGESLAKMEIFSFFTTILQRYNIESSDGSIPSTDFVSGITSIPVPFFVRLKSRAKESLASG